MSWSMILLSVVSIAVLFILTYLAIGFLQRLSVKSIGKRIAIWMIAGIILGGSIGIIGAIIIGKALSANTATDLGINYDGDLRRIITIYGIRGAIIGSVSVLMAGLSDYVFEKSGKKKQQRQG